MARYYPTITFDSTVAHLVVDVRSGAFALQLVAGHSGEVIEKAKGKEAERLSNRLRLSPSLFVSYCDDDIGLGAAPSVRAIYAPL